MSVKNEKNEENQIRVGMKGEFSLTVSEENTAESLGSGSLPVFATPAMITAMEAAACNALGLEGGSTSVGTAVNISHVSATPLGMRVTAWAEVTAVNGRMVEFSVRAHDESGLIGSGAHSRVIVDADRFLKKVYEKQKNL
ncbi:MAG: thioesterase family protein [Christensenellales bacterium]|jgi:fluoroacetyl-CoA thioesterase